MSMLAVIMLTEAFYNYYSGCHHAESSIFIALLAFILLKVTFSLCYAGCHHAESSIFFMLCWLSPC